MCNASNRTVLGQVLQSHTTTFICELGDLVTAMKIVLSL